LEIVKNDGRTSKSLPEVLGKWADDFESLYNCSYQEADHEHADPRMIHKSMLENSMQDPLYCANDTLNCLLSMQEVQAAVNRSKAGKAVGIDRIPNEILKLEPIVELLHKLFQLIFDCGKIPSEWQNALILPIPKDAKNDKRIPLHYRGISLLSCISKIYSSVLNKRIVTYSDQSEDIIISDEQNGFRSGRSCNEHLFTVTSIVRNRNNVNEDTYAAFIDLKKAFDFVNRDLLLYRLLLAGIDGNMYQSIKSIYANTLNSIKVNEHQTRWFEAKTGVRQGDNLSPTLFNIFINDLIVNIKETNIGINIHGTMYNIFMYADDIILLCANEYDLQQLLNRVNRWCRDWKLEVNTSKSKIMHFRKKSKPVCDYTFKLGNEDVEIVSKYKYLGIILDEHIDYRVTSEVLASASGRALGSIISKLKTFNAMGFVTYSKLFDSGVTSVMDYAAEVWGYSDYTCSNKVTERAMRAFLGVHRFTPLAFLYGDMMWLKPRYRRWLSMLRFWNRLISMDDNRIAKHIFLWDYNICNNNWSYELKNIFNELHLDHFENLSLCNIEMAKASIWEKMQQDWLNDVNAKPKLRTYKLYKTELAVENYVSMNLNRQERSVVAQFRSGILPLRVETGRFRGEAVEERLCTFCKQNVVEDEMHFLFHCDCYIDLKDNLNQIMHENHLDNKTEIEIVNFLFQNNPRQIAKYLTSAFLKRRHILYK